MLGQIESGKSVPTIALLGKVAATPRTTKDISQMGVVEGRDGANDDTWRNGHVPDASRDRHAKCGTSRKQIDDSGERCKGRPKFDLRRFSMDKS